jgi:hypothetical protein
MSNTIEDSMRKLTFLFITLLVCNFFIISPPLTWQDSDFYLTTSLQEPLRDTTATNIDLSVSNEEKSGDTNDNIIEGNTAFNSALSVNIIFYLVYKLTFKKAE